MLGQCSIDKNTRVCMRKTCARGEGGDWDVRHVVEPRYDLPMAKLRSHDRIGEGEASARRGKADSDMMWCVVLHFFCLGIHKMCVFVHAA